MAVILVVTWSSCLAHIHININSSSWPVTACKSVNDHISLWQRLMSAGHVTEGFLFGYDVYYPWSI